MQELTLQELEAIGGGSGWDFGCGVLAGVTIASAVSGFWVVTALTVNKAVVVCGMAILEDA
jgi:hypothetical protein